MSAIWGCVDLSGAELEPDLPERMERPLRENKIDRYERANRGAVAMGCGIQYIYAGSEREALPVFDTGSGVFFTADCVLDNRPELIPRLCPNRADIPDGELLYLAYLKWGEDAPKHLVGSFTYAVYERDKNRLILSVDHTHTRAVYYCRRGSRVYFGTLIESILAGIGEAPKLNEEWALMFLAMVPLTIQRDPAQTPYLGVKRVLAASYRVFSVDGDRDARYWSPKDVAPLKLGSDGEYRECFRAIMERCARDAARDCHGDVGILLSSGLDSSAVAAFVSPELEKQGRRLRGYTYVPLDGYSQHFGRGVVTNEKEGVLKTCEMYPNIVPNFLSCPGIDGFNAIDYILKAHELPYKSLTNLAWIYELERRAAEDGCKVMLDGQLGNATISWGDMMTYEKRLILKGRVLKAASVMSRFAEKANRSRRLHLKYLSQSFIPKPVWRLLNRDYLAETLVNRETAKALGIGRKDKRLEKNAMLPTVFSYSKTRELIHNVDALAHISDADTKFTLRHGMVKRDITRDIRVCEFCVGAPIECFVNDEPATRRAVRSYMDDLLPADLLSENAPRGRQSGDWLYRLMPRWPEIYEDLNTVCLSDELGKYADAGLVSRALDKFRDGPDPRDEMEFMRLGAAYVLGVFLRGREWMG